MNTGSPPLLVCLLPVRNAAAQLPAWLDSVAVFADAVVALDDGSTDDTGAILAAHPLVKAVLTNPVRAGHLGWHDGRNRNRLLAAAGALQPRWIMSLDADERMDPTDGAALRRFVETDALPGCAYNFRVYRMGAGETYDPQYQWVTRLFAHREGQRFPNRRLDLVPVPVTLGPERWISTTLRIKHYGDAGDTERDQRLAKYHDADPERLFADYYENLPEPTPGPLPPWRPRESSTPVLEPAPDRLMGPGRPHVVCLLPARDCAHLLPGWFQSIERVADAVVALDDGSLDETARLLAEHPLVVRLLTSPRREGFAGWDDGDNRNRLLAAASELAPEWIISVDADERIPLEDAVALRRFLRFAAQPGHAYALASYRMIGDEDHYDRLDYDAYRLFAWEPGQLFPPARLHAPPVPTSIPATAWRQTTIRMKHLVSLTEADRLARRAKFAQADPDFEWEPSYDYTTEAPGPVKRWEPRPFDRPFLVHGPGGVATPDELDLDGPVLSVVLVVEPGEERVAAERLLSLRAGCEDTVELMVATRDGYAAEVIERLVEDVVLVRARPEWSAAGLRNESARTARGDYILFLDGTDTVDAAGLDAVVETHERGAGVVRVPVVDAAANASAAADLRRAGSDLGTVPASFVREPVLAAGGFDDNVVGGLDEGMGQRLMAKGFTTATVDAMQRVRGPAPTVPAAWFGEMRRHVQRRRRRS